MKSNIHKVETPRKALDYGTFKRMGAFKSRPKRIEFPKIKKEESEK